MNEADPTLALEVRIGVNSGETLVALDARPDLGEGIVSGDVVNTGARLQSAAPPGGILVDEHTFRATERAIEYEAHEPIAAKGKAEPVPAWRAVARRASFGIDLADSRSPLVGREDELDVLVSALARARIRLEPQLVTVVGVPGIGKSRLVRELFRVVDEDPELIHWRQGRSLPYGEGSAFWGLAEIVKAQAAILETDAADDAVAKVAAVVRRSRSRRDRGRVDRASSAVADRGPAGEVVGASRPRRVLRRLEAFSRGARGEAAGRPRLRGSPLGRRRAARLRRLARRSGDRRFAARRGLGSAGAPRAPAWLGRWEAQRGDDLTRAALGRGHCPTPRRSAPHAGPPGRAAGGAAAAGRGEPALRGGVRADARGRERSCCGSRDPAGRGRRADRCSSGGGEGATPARGGSGEGLLDRRAGEPLGGGLVASGGAHARSRAEGVREARASLGGRRLEAVRLRPRARARRGVRPDVARCAGGRPPAGCGLDRDASAGPRG